MCFQSFNIFLEANYLHYKKDSNNIYAIFPKVFARLPSPACELE